jgi:hypothetical protein
VIRTLRAEPTNSQVPRHLVKHSNRNRVILLTASAQVRLYCEKTSLGNKIHTHK